mmetsp:Transcript_3689/g.9446  ORF Transcript_3689/g.9446 Transcript_3689/m.9446 type:complete len:1202 (-) Transcript_3689:82-3687(-)
MAPVLGSDHARRRLQSQAHHDQSVDEAEDGDEGAQKPVAAAVVAELSQARSALEARARAVAAELQGKLASEREALHGSVASAEVASGDAGGGASRGAVGATVRASQAAQAENAWLKVQLREVTGRVASLEARSRQSQERAGRAEASLRDLRVVTQNLESERDAAEGRAARAESDALRLGCDLEAVLKAGEQHREAVAASLEDGARELQERIERAERASREAVDRAERAMGEKGQLEQLLEELRGNMEEEQARGDELARKLRETMAKVSDSYEDLQNEREKTEKLEVSVKDLTRICEEHRKQNTAAQHGPDAAHAAEAAHVAGATPQAFDIAPADRNLALLRDVQDERDALSALLKSSQRQCDELRAEVARVKVKCRSMENTQTSFRSQSDTWQRITQDMQEQLSATEGQLETAEEKRLRAEKQRDLAEQQLNAEKQCKEEAEGLVHALEQEICVLEGTIREQHQDGAAFCDVVDPPATAEERALLVALPSSAEAEPSAERCTRGAPAHDFVNAPTAGTGKLVVDHSGWPVLPVHVRPGDLEDGHGGIEDGGRRGVSFARGAQAAEVADGVEEEEKEEEIEEIEDVEEASVDTWDSPAAAVWRHRGESAPSLRGAGFGGSAFGLGGASRFSETWHGWRPADASQFAALAFDDGTENSDSYTAGREESPRRDEAPLRSRSAGDSPSRSGTASTSNVHSPPSARRGIASASAANVRSSSARVGEQLTPPVAPHGQGPSAAFHAAQPRSARQVTAAAPAGAVAPPGIVSRDRAAASEPTPAAETAVTAEAEPAEQPLPADERDRLRRLALENVALHEANRKTRVLLDEMTSRLRRMRAAAEESGQSKAAFLTEIAQQAGLGEVFGSPPRNVFERLYWDSLLRLRRLEQVTRRIHEQERNEMLRAAAESGLGGESAQLAAQTRAVLKRFDNRDTRAQQATTSRRDVNADEGGPITFSAEHSGSSRRRPEDAAAPDAGTTLALPAPAVVVRGAPNGQVEADTGVPSAAFPCASRSSERERGRGRRMQPLPHPTTTGMLAVGTRGTEGWTTHCAEERHAQHPQPLPPPHGIANRLMVAQPPMPAHSEKPAASSCSPNWRLSSRAVPSPPVLVSTLQRCCSSKPSAAFKNEAKLRSTWWGSASGGSAACGASAAAARTGGWGGGSDSEGATVALPSLSRTMPRYRGEGLVGSQRQLRGFGAAAPRNQWR